MYDYTIIKCLEMTCIYLEWVMRMWDEILDASDLVLFVMSDELIWGETVQCYK